MDRVQHLIPAAVAGMPAGEAAKVGTICQTRSTSACSGELLCEQPREGLLCRPNRIRAHTAQGLCWACTRRSITIWNPRNNTHYATTATLAADREGRDIWITIIKATFNIAPDRMAELVL